MSLGLSDEKIVEMLPDIVADILAFEIEKDREGFLGKTYQSQQKVMLIEDDRFDAKEYQTHSTKEYK